MEAARPPRRTPPLVDLVLGAVALLAALWVYRRLPRIFFFSDDLCAMCHLASEGFVSFVTAPLGSHILYVRNLVFWLVYGVAGFDPTVFYGSVLIIHLVNVALLFAWLRVWTGSALLACFGGMLWGTSPLMRGTLTWYAASGQALAAAFVLAVLLSLARHETRGLPVTIRTVFGWSLLLILGASCFGTGIAAAVVFPLVAFLVLPRPLWRPGTRPALLVLPALVAALHTAAPAIHRLTAGGTSAVHQMAQHLAGVFTKAGAALVLPSLRELLVHAWVVLVGGWIWPVIGPDVRPAWGPSAVALGCAALVVGLVAAGGIVRRRLFAMLLLAATIYALIAIGRGGFWLKYNLPVEEFGAVERYHLLGAIPLVALVCLLLSPLAPLRRAFRVPAVALLAVWFGLSVAGYRRSDFRIDTRDRLRAAVAHALAAVDREIDARPPGAVAVLLNRDPAGVALRGLVMPYDTMPGVAGLLLARDHSDVVRGRRVVFIESDAKNLIAIRRRYVGRMRELILSPEEASRIQAEGRAVDGPPSGPALTP